MADYPDIPQGVDTQLTPVSGMQIDRADSGRVRGRDFYDEASFDLELTHPLVTAADRLVLEEFYGINRSQVFTITYAGDGSVYEMIFKAPPAFSWQGVDNTGNWYTAAVSMAGKRVT